MISVVIRAKNEMKTLPKLIEALKMQTYRDFEIVVIDNESTDGTYEYAKKTADRVVTIRNEEFTHARSTNLGVKHAKGEYIYFTNGHCLPKSDALLKTAKKLLDANEKLIGVYGRNWVNHDPKRKNKVEELMGVYDHLIWPKAYKIFSKYVAGILQTTSCCIRSVQLKKYPFKELRSGGGEDALWAVERFKEGWQAAYHPDLDVYHSHGVSNWQAIRRFASYDLMMFEVWMKGYFYR